jgi:integrase
MSKVMEKVRYGDRGQGTLIRLDDRPNWFSVLSVNGKQVEMSTGTADLREARKFHKAKLEELVLDKHGKAEFLTPAHQRLQIGALLDELVADYRVRSLKSLGTVLSHLKPLRAHFGTWRAVALKPKDLKAYIEKRRAKGKSNATINRELELLRRTLRLAHEQGQLPTEVKVPMLEENNTRQGFATRSQLEAIVAHLPEWLQDFARFAFITGMRKGEIASLRWEDVDREVGAVRLKAENAKTGEARTLMVVGDLAELMERRFQARLFTRVTGTPFVSEYVFHRKGQPIEDFRGPWERACSAAGIPRLLFHDLRRSAVRNMDRAGVSRHVAMAISGHKTESMYQRYNIVSEADLRAAAEKTQLYLDTLPGLQNASN